MNNLYDRQARGGEGARRAAILRATPFFGMEEFPEITVGTCNCYSTSLSSETAFVIIQYSTLCEVR